MADLVVNTDEVYAAGVELTQVARVAEELGAGGGRLSALVPAVGGHRAAQAVARFGDAWLYGVGWIGVQAQELARQLMLAAAAYAAVEARLSTAADGDAPTVHVPPVATAPPAAAPTRPNWTLLAATTAPPVQLSSATHVSALVPGDPELTRTLARSVLAFADDLVDAFSAVRRIALGGWVGAAARAVETEATELLRRLRVAEAAFAAAADALTRYCGAHADARAMAEQALRTWQAAEHASAVARGAVVGGAPVLLPSGADPETEMARAVALLRAAREILDAAERAMVAALEDACRGAPTDPGAMAQFSAGLAEGLTGIVTGPVHMAVLAGRINPARLMYDPHGWLADQQALWTGVWEVLKKHPNELAGDLIDLDTLRSNPARWAGQWTPEMVALICTGGAAALNARAGTQARLRTVADDVNAARRDGTLSPRVDPSRTPTRLGELRHAPNTPAGLAAARQLGHPYGVPDRWEPVVLRPGQRFARVGDYLVPIHGPLPSSARDFYESLQARPSRSDRPDGSVTQPGHRDSVEIYEVRGEIDAAAARAEMHPQYGPGGRTRAFVPDFDDLADAGLVHRLDGPDGVHQFDSKSLKSEIEDPDFRALDPTLPEDALDPRREAGRAAAQVGAEKVRDHPVGVAVAASADRLNEEQRMDPHTQGAP